MTSKAMAVKVYIDKDKPFQRFVSPKARFQLGDRIFLRNHSIGQITGIGMEGKSLAIHIKSPYECY